MDEVPNRSRRLQVVLESAAQLQILVPDAVLIGGTASALYAGHRDSIDHDHDLADLEQRYLEVLDAVEASEGWATSVRASQPPMTILGSLNGIEAGLRQLRRSRPLETCTIEVAPDLFVTAPTEAEALRTKAYFIVARNNTRDFLDVAALSEHFGATESIATLTNIDDYYVDRSKEYGSVRTALVLALSAPSPRDGEVTRELDKYKGLDPRWHNWNTVVEVCQQLALGIAEDPQ